MKHTIQKRVGPTNTQVGPLGGTDPGIRRKSNEVNTVIYATSSQNGGQEFKGFLKEGLPYEDGWATPLRITLQTSEFCHFLPPIMPTSFVAARRAAAQFMHRCKVHPAPIKCLNQKVSFWLSCTQGWILALARRGTRCSSLLQM